MSDLEITWESDFADLKAAVIAVGGDHGEALANASALILRQARINTALLSLILDQSIGKSPDPDTLRQTLNDCRDLTGDFRELLTAVIKVLRNEA